jgi:hypothetical protein
MMLISLRITIRVVLGTLMMVKPSLMQENNSHLVQQTEQLSLKQVKMKNLGHSSVLVVLAQITLITLKQPRKSMSKSSKIIYGLNLISLGCFSIVSC